MAKKKNSYVREVPDFETKVDILVDLIVGTAGVKEWDAFKLSQSLGLSLALAHQARLARLNPKGDQYVEETYEALLEALNVEGVFANWSEISDAALKKQQKWKEER